MSSLRCFSNLSSILTALSWNSICRSDEKYWHCLASFLLNQTFSRPSTFPEKEQKGPFLLFNFTSSSQLLFLAKKSLRFKTCLRPDFFAAGLLKQLQLENQSSLKKKLETWDDDGNFQTFDSTFRISGWIKSNLNGSRQFSWKQGNCSFWCQPIKTSEEETTFMLYYILS